ncbi:MAG: hypothetical protein WJ306_05490 [Ferrovum myxofaciens]
MADSPYVEQVKFPELGQSEYPTHPRYVAANNRAEYARIAGATHRYHATDGIPIEASAKEGFMMPLAIFPD